MHALDRLLSFTSNRHDCKCCRSVGFLVAYPVVLSNNCFVVVLTIISPTILAGDTRSVFIVHFAFTKTSGTIKVHYSVIVSDHLSCTYYPLSMLCLLNFTLGYSYSSIHQVSILDTFLSNQEVEHRNAVGNTTCK